MYNSTHFNPTPTNVKLTSLVRLTGLRPILEQVESKHKAALDRAMEKVKSVAAAAAEVVVDVEVVEGGVSKSLFRSR